MRTMAIVVGMLTVVTAALPARADLVAGAAVRDITPPIGGMMGGYGDRGLNVSTGVHDPLMAKALVLKDDGRTGVRLGESKAFPDTALAIVTMDLVGVPSKSIAPIREAVREKAGIDELMLLASHTHSGPDTGFAMPSTEKPWSKVFEEKVIDAVVSASEAAAPVRYGVGTGEVREGHNRRKVLPDGTCEMLWRNPERAPTQPVDYELGVIRFETTDGAPVATLVNFACHPVILGPENLEISADWPGAMMRLVEKQVGGVCLFANGACGDINPFMEKTAPKDGAFEEVEKMGRSMAEEVVRVAGSLEMRDGADAALTARTEAVPIALRWDIDDPEVIAAFEEQYGTILVKLALDRLRSKFGGPLAGDLVTVTLGARESKAFPDLAIAGLPGEFFVELGLDLKRRSAFPYTFAFGYCNKGYAYFPTVNAAWQGGYGGKEATVVEVGAGEKFINKALVNLYYQTGRLSAIPKF